MKTLKQIKEQIAMSVGSNATAGGQGGIAGLEPDFPPVAAGITTMGHMLRRNPPAMFSKYASKYHNKFSRRRKK